MVDIKMRSHDHNEKCYYMVISIKLTFYAMKKTWNKKIIKLYAEIMYWFANANSVFRSILDNRGDIH
jgi:hypothetical protein